jgi:hypothetical protein
MHILKYHIQIVVYKEEMTDLFDVYIFILHTTYLYTIYNTSNIDLESRICWRLDDELELMSRERVDDEVIFATTFITVEF